MKKLHLVCNAHLDPTWLWEWEEGASSALSTFRSAADLAEEFDYIFCHNEVTLYKWVEEYEPELFVRIQKLVKSGKWHIMGGWYLQPDCNMPSGESFVRQALTGREYFEEKFGVKPSTAVNFDPFGHSWGLPQILKKCGFDSYLCCRPGWELKIPNEFVWEGVDGSQVFAMRANTHYNSPLGRATEKIRGVLKQWDCADSGKACDTPVKDSDIVLWGVGNHGGGPSRKDLADIQALAEEFRKKGVEILHSAPETYFDDRKKEGLYLHKGGINRCMPGCYTSQIRIKQLHRKLENELYGTEKMLSHASAAGLLEYPFRELNEAQEDLMNAEFHDILPGTTIAEGEEYGIRLMNHGLEILNRLRAKAFFALCSGEPAAKPGEFPVLVYNPHPYPVRATVDVGFNLEDQNYEEFFYSLEAYDKSGKQLPAQVIREKSNLNLDWMKRVVFECELSPSSVSRFDVRKVKLAARPDILGFDKAPEVSAKIKFDNGRISAEIDPKTGLLKSCAYLGKQILRSGAFCPAVYSDNEDPWGMGPDQLAKLGDFLGDFSLLSPEEAAFHSGLGERGNRGAAKYQNPSLPAVRIVEDGEEFLEVESLLGYGHSAARLCYRFYKHRDEIDVNLNLFWFEKNRLLKLRVPYAFEGRDFNDIAFGREEIADRSGAEYPVQKYAMRLGSELGVSSLLSDGYGMSVEGADLLLTLVRGAAYAAHPIYDRKIVSSNRYTQRMDQGEQNYSFRILLGAAGEIEKRTDSAAAAFSEKPYALCVFPRAFLAKPMQSPVVLDNSEITETCFKKSKDGSYILRLHNNHGRENSAVLNLLGQTIKLKFTPYEVKTLKYSSGKLGELKTMEI